VSTESVIITVKGAETVAVCRECLQRVGQPHRIDCPIYIRTLHQMEMKTAVQTAGRALRGPNWMGDLRANYLLVQERLKEIYGPGSYYHKYAAVEWGYNSDIALWLGLQATKETGLGNVLDIGPGWGTLACLCKRLGASGVQVIDKMAYLTPPVLDEFGLNLTLCDIERETVIPTYNEYDVILLTEVLEHFNFNPIPTLSRIEQTLRNEKSRLLISTPDQASWGRCTKYMNTFEQYAFYDQGKHSGRAWVDDHVWHYSEHELRSVVVQAGMTITSLTRTKSAGGYHFNAVCAPASL
jgi:2-polyprenyl-3-methyl-5-hydroxy-6-metoxy-1,4-benzoquinol methylase